MAVRKKILSAHTIGLEVLLPGTGTFHRTFCVSLHVNGGLPVGETPEASGPRQVGQYPSAEPQQIFPADSVNTSAESINVPVILVTVCPFVC